MNTWIRFALGISLSVPTAALAQQAPAGTDNPPIVAPAPLPPAPPPEAAVAPAPAAPPPVVAPAPAPTPPAAAPATEPLAGISDGSAFLRSSDGQFVLLPGGRLQVDNYFFKSENATPNRTFLLKRARAELAGWVGSSVFFSIAGDFATGAPAGANPVAQGNLATTDDFVALAPWGDKAILQVGQFDAPFTLENRTSDKYFDFMERSITVRAFGIPSNKEMGAMLHGLHPDKLFYYSAGVFNGDGQNFRNADTKFDVMGRAWIAPLALSGLDAAKAITVGGSGWVGKHSNGLALAGQSTQAGFSFFKPSWSMTNAMGTAVPLELHQNGTSKSWALELDAPIAHKVGARWEFVHKNQLLSSNDVTKPDKQIPGGATTLNGYSTYGEVWAWIVGDDRIIGAPGLQLPSRFKKFGTTAPAPGLMVAARVEHLDETITDAAATAGMMLGDKSVGHTKLTSFELGLNYWYSKRFRASFNYVVNHFDGDAPFIQAFKSKNEQEFLTRLGIAL